MFGLFKSSKKKLEKKRETLLKQAFQWSKIDRKLSDEYYAQADAIDKELAGM
ncbi:MAG: Lacal_2735 family protein [Salibacteraceae bacterium]